MDENKDAQGHQERVAKPNYKSFFSIESATLPLEEKQKIALDYISQFSMRPLDPDVIQEAGIKREDIKEGIVWSATDGKYNPVIAELRARLNYCQYISQSKPDKLPETYDRMRLDTNMSREGVKEIHSPNEVVVTLEEPFFYDKRANQVKQYQFEDKQEMISAAQMINRASSIMGEKISIPSTAVGVLYFSKPS